MGLSAPRNHIAIAAFFPAVLLVCLESTAQQSCRENSLTAMFLSTAPCTLLPAALGMEPLD